MKTILETEFTEIPLSDLNYHNAAKRVSELYAQGKKNVFDFLRFEVRINVKTDKKTKFLYIKNDTPINLIFELGFAVGRQNVLSRQD